MEIDIKNYSIGVMVARFQVDELHEGQHYVIKQVTENHKKTVIFLGVPKFVGTQKDPLDFETRKRMILQNYPDITICPLPDQGDDARWTKELDKRIREVHQHGEVLLYGGRDSFIPHYINGGGTFKTKELKSLGTFTGTDIRKLISEEVRSSKDFRSGVIYHTYNAYPRVLPTVDIAIFNEEGHVLLEKKDDEVKFRFVGGFVKPKDDNMLSTAKRVAGLETGNNVNYGDFKLLTTMRIDDWRFRGEDTIMTTFFRCKKLWGPISPGRGIAELKWFELNKIDLNEVVNEHHPLVEYLKTKKI